MSGVAVIVAKLKAHAPLTILVPAARMMAGEVPLNTALPNIAVTSVVDVPRTPVSASVAGRMNTERVQVTVMVSGIQTTTAGTGYPGLDAILKLVLAACGNTRGPLAGVHVDSILPDTKGPDFFPQNPSMAVSSRDFIVKWITA
jgi:hypothetical protein